MSGICNNPASFILKILQNRSHGHVQNINESTTAQSMASQLFGTFQHIVVLLIVSLDMPFLCSSFGVLSKSVCFWQAWHVLIRLAIVKLRDYWVYTSSAWCHFCHLVNVGSVNFTPSLISQLSFMELSIQQRLLQIQYGNDFLCFIHPSPELPLLMIRVSL